MLQRDIYPNSISLPLRQSHFRFPPNSAMGLEARITDKMKQCSVSPISHTNENFQAPRQGANKE
jgi:hypothetical protein